MPTAPIRVGTSSVANHVIPAFRNISFHELLFLEMKVLWRFNDSFSKTTPAAVISSIECQFELPAFRSFDHHFYSRFSPLIGLGLYNELCQAIYHAHYLSPSPIDHVLLDVFRGRLGRFTDRSVTVFDRLGSFQRFEVYRRAAHDIFAVRQ